MTNPQESERIRLAEFLGWTGIEGICGYPPDAHEDTRWHLIPDPFQDANDDYAILERMRGDMKFVVALCGVMKPTVKPWNYKVGDYARAALKVLEGERS